MNRRPTTQDISWFLDLHNNNQLELSPPYQRRSVWTLKDRKFFLDTIFRDYPCPAIFLHKTLNDKNQSIYNVVDGKQRLETIIAFVNNKIAISKDFGDATLDGKKWKDLKHSIDLQNKFWDYVLTVEMVKTVEGNVLNNVFDRLNRNSRKLERQELRHAKYDGWLISLAEKESDKEEWKKLNVVTTSRAKRMKDVQFLSELLIVLIDGQMAGFDQDHIDDKYAEYDDPSETQVDFSEELFIDRLETIKNYLIEMENHNQCITTHAKTFGSFYTLWSIVALHFLDAGITPTNLAERYVAFMEKVNEIAAQENLETFLLEKGEGHSYSEPLQYYKNAMGASTDLTQREQRYYAVIKGLSN